MSAFTRHLIRFIAATGRLFIRLCYRVLPEQAEIRPRIARTDCSETARTEVNY